MYLISLVHYIFYPFLYELNKIFAGWYIKTKFEMINSLNFLKLFFFTAWEISLEACPWTLFIYFFLHDPSTSTFRKYLWIVSWFEVLNFKSSSWFSAPPPFFLPFFCKGSFSVLYTELLNHYLGYLQAGPVEQQGPLGRWRIKYAILVEFTDRRFW